MRIAAIVVMLVVICQAGLVSAQPTAPVRPLPDSPSAAACDLSYPDFCIPPPPPDLNCGDPVIAGRHNFTVRPPDPHHFDTDHDGKGCEAAVNDTPTPTPTTPPNPVATATFTPPPSTSVSCSPRPRVVVTATRGGPGLLQATISASSNPTGPPNTLQALTFGAIRNATVEVIGIGPATSGQQIALAGGTSTVALTVTGQNTFVPMTVTDRCGDWKTFVGIGAGG